MRKHPRRLMSPAARRLFFEPLESRVLLSASGHSLPQAIAPLTASAAVQVGSAEIENGTLTVQGTSSNDVILLQQDSRGRVLVLMGGRRLGPFVASQVLVEGLAGNDVLRAIGKFSKPLTLLGGDGNDMLEGGRGPDHLQGEAGNDVLRGGGGNDVLDGGEGRDVLDGQSGNDELLGGLGNDVILGGKGNDTASGGHGADIVHGNDGHDSLSGDAGDDLLDGGPGKDILSAGAGNDRLYGQAGRDLLIGGDGADRVEGGGQDDILIAGQTIHDSDPAGLDAVLAQWTAELPYAVRVAAISSELAGQEGLDLSTVFDDQDVDQLLGAGGSDWYFAAARDRLLDQRKSETRLLTDGLTLPSQPLLNRAVVAKPGVQQMPSVTVNPHNPNHVVIAYMDYSLPTADVGLPGEGYAGIGVAISRNGGNTWQSSSIPLPAGFDQGAANPIAKFDDQGRVYVSFMSVTFLERKPPITNGDFFNPEIGASDRAPGMQANNGIFLARSDNGGVNWNPPVAVVSHLYEGQDVFFEVVPDLAIDNFRVLPDGRLNPNYGNLYSVWTRLYPSGQVPGHPDFGGGSDLMIAVSRDSGRTWTTQLQRLQNGLEVTTLLDPITVGNFGLGTGAADQGHVTVGPNGDLYVANFGGGDFVVQHSNDAGTTFTVPNHETGKGIAFGIGFSAFPNPAGLPNSHFRTHTSREIVADPVRPGQVYAVEQIKIVDLAGKSLDPADILFARSTDYGQTWQSMFRVGKGAAAVLNDDNGGKKATGSDPQEIATSQAQPRLAIDSQGNISVNWLDARRDPADRLLDVFGTVSTDGGQTFSPNFRITDVSFDADQGRFNDARGRENFYLGDFLGLDVERNSAYSAWTDTRGGNQDIFFSRFGLDPAPRALNDRFEPNDTVAAATTLGTISQRVVPKLAAAPGDEDWFRLTSAATGDLIISMLLDNPATTLSDAVRIELWNENGTTRLATDSELHGETGDFVGREARFPVNAGQQFLVRIVDSAGGDEIPLGYSLKLQSLTANLGTRVSAQVGASLAAGGAALYLVRAAAAGSIEVELTNGFDVQGDLNVQVLDPNTLSSIVNKQPAIVAAAEPNDSIGQANATGLSGSGIVRAFGTVGDGAFAETSGDYDFYRFQANAGQQVTIDLSAKAVSSSLDGVIGLYDSAGRLLAAQDSFGPGDSELLSFVTDKADAYSVVVTGCCAGAVFPADPQTPGTGTGKASTGPYRVTITSEAVGPGSTERISLPVQQGQAVLLQVSGVAESSGSFTLGYANLDQFTTNLNASLLFPAGDGPSQSELADLNADGNPDLVVTNGQSDTVSILLGNGDGTFKSPRQFTVGAFDALKTSFGGRLGNFRRQVSVGDYSGDSIPDLAITNYDSSDISVLLGNGDGTFQPQRRFDATRAPYDVANGDFNNDGRLDLAAVEATSFVTINTAVLLGQGNGTQGNGTFEPQRIFAAPLPVADSFPLSTVGTADLNDDGKDDLVISGSNLQKLFVFLSNGDGTFTRIADADSARLGAGLAFGDINGDGDVDIVTTGIDDGNQASVLLGNGDGTFQPRRVFFTGQNPIGVEIVDVGRQSTLPDGTTILGPPDAHPDLVVAVSGVELAVASVGGPGVVVLPGIFDEQGTFVGFGAPLPFADAVLPLDVDSGDVNRDGAVDVAVVDSDGIRVVFGKPPLITPNNARHTARDLGTVVHVVQPTLTITPSQTEAWFRFKVPTEAVAAAGDQIVDISALTEHAEGAGLGVELRNNAGDVVAGGARIRTRLAQGAEMFVRVFALQNGQGQLGAGAYTLVLNVLPQVVSVEAQALLPGVGNQPGGPTTSIVLTLQGDRLDPVTAQNKANYRVTWLGPNDAIGGGDDQVIPISNSSQAVVYSPSSNVDLPTGTRFPTAVHQTVALLFDQPLPVGSYQIDVLPAVQTEDFNSDEDALLSGGAALNGHPIVQASDPNLAGGVTIMAPNLVQAPGELGSFSAFDQGTEFLSQLHDDLAAILDGTLTLQGDDPNLSQSINNHIRERLAAGFSSAAPRKLLAIWLDPGSFEITDPTGDSINYDIGDDELFDGIDEVFIDVIGNIEIIVLAVLDGIYDFSVSDLGGQARGGYVLVDAEETTDVTFTDELRSGTTEFEIDTSEDP